MAIGALKAVFKCAKTSVYAAALYRRSPLPASLKASWRQVAYVPASLPTLPSSKRSDPQKSISNIMAMSSVAFPTDRPLYDAFIHGDPATETIEPCPICQSVLLVLDEKGLKYNRRCVHVLYRPERLKKAAGYDIPVIRDLHSDESRWIMGLPEISRYLEERHPEISLGVIGNVSRQGSNQASQAVIDGLWSAFLSYLEAAQGDDESEHAALEDRLQDAKRKLADKRYLQSNTDITVSDLALVPRLHHIMTALPELKMAPVAESRGEFLLEKGWQLPKNMHCLQDYVERVRDRDSFHKSDPSDRAIIDYWRDYQEKHHKQYRKHWANSEKSTVDDAPIWANKGANQSDTKPWRDPFDFFKPGDPN